MYIFKPKVQIWVNFGDSWNGRCRHILCPFGIFYSQLPYYMAIWFIFWLISIFIPVLVRCSKKILATLVPGRWLKPL
jgi:hypothetical protein